MKALLLCAAALLPTAPELQIETRKVEIVLQTEGIDAAREGRKVDVPFLQQVVLGYAARFPEAGDQAMRFASRFCEYAKAWNIAEASPQERRFVEAMKDSPSPALREFAAGKERVQRAREEPLELRVPGLEGGWVDLSEYRGKVVLLDFWSLTCGSCVETLPRLKEVYERLHDQGFEIIGVAFEHQKNRTRSAAEIRLLTRKLGLLWPQALTEEFWESSPLYKRFGFTYVPNYFLLDRSGRLVSTDINRGKGPVLEEKVRELLESAPAQP